MDKKFKSAVTKLNALERLKGGAGEYVCKCMCRCLYSSMCLLQTTPSGGCLLQTTPSGANIGIRYLVHMKKGVYKCRK